MTPSEQELWTRIVNFELDNPQASFQFSARLSRENGWSKDYTHRVIKEYKRFIFLCCISSSGVTPSDPVDQVWHLHLTYTKSYWTDLCKNTLYKEIHHNPTKGGRLEASKFDSYYSNLKLLYVDKFGYSPPSDIWHDNKMRFSDIDFQRINLRQHWVIKKPKISRNYFIPLILFCTALLFIQAQNNDIVVFLIITAIIVLFGLIVKAIRGKGVGDSGCASSGCSTSGCSTSSGHHHSDDGGDSGCSDSGCSGCSGD
jgi:hypothetical protein